MIVNSFKPTARCVFLDRDGVLNEDLGDYLFRLEDLVIPDGVNEALQKLKSAGYLLIVITNQAGISKGLYTEEAVYAIHEKMQEMSASALDDLYFSPYHEKYSGSSLSRKPGSLMLEKAMSKYNINPAQSWMVGDRDRDIQAGEKAGLRTVHIVSGDEKPIGLHYAGNLLEAADIILSQTF
jgi:D-glycero-D-manno-heptose 1,7-bisphosphate phosphatase